MTTQGTMDGGRLCQSGLTYHQDTPVLNKQSLTLTIVCDPGQNTITILDPNCYFECVISTLTCVEDMFGNEFNKGVGHIQSGSTSESVSVEFTATSSGDENSTWRIDCLDAPWFWCTLQFNPRSSN